MGLSFKKKTIFGSKTKKIAANFCNRRIQTVCLRTFPTSPPIKGQKHTRRRNEADEFAAMMEGWNSKHLSFFSFHTNSFFSFTQILSHKSKISGLCTRTQMENYCCGWKASSNSTKLLCQVKKLMVLQPMNAKCVTSFRGIPRRCDNTWLDMTYKVRGIGLHATKFSNLSSHVCCAVFETRMVSIQERTQTPWMGALCGLRPKTRNQHTIVSWSRRWSPTGPGHQRTNVDGSLQTGKIRNLQNQVRILSRSTQPGHLTPNGTWASPISGEREGDPRISDFLSENDGGPLYPYVLGHLLIGNGRCRRTEINAS